MSRAYLLAFALALTPVLMQLVGMVSFGTAVVRWRRSMGHNWVTQTFPAWPLLLFSLFAIGISVAQGVYVSFLFDEVFYDYGTRAVDVLGVSVPLALGAKINDFVQAVSVLLLNAAVLASVVVMVFLPSRLFKPQMPVWLFKLVFVGLGVYLVWVSWRSWGLYLEDIRALFAATTNKLTG